jgi:hypothetical protein
VHGILAEQPHGSMHFDQCLQYACAVRIDLFVSCVGFVQPVDAVYIALGKVLTISGRTIREEAQSSPAIIQEAQEAIEGVLAKVRGGVGLDWYQVPATLSDTTSFGP